MDIGQFTLGIQPALAVGDAAALALVEYFDDPSTRLLSRRAAIKQLLEVRTTPGASIPETLEEVIEMAEPYGDRIKLLLNTGGSLEVATMFQAARRQGELTRRIQYVALGGGDRVTEEAGIASIPFVEVTLALTAAVNRVADGRFKDGRLIIRPGGPGIDAFMRAADDVAVEATSTGKPRLSAVGNAQVLAVALATYPKLAPPQYGRRYQVRGRTYASVQEAVARLGQGALSA